MKLLEHFKELSLHPNNAEELKGLILQLAVQGKLTANWREKNPDVEPASILIDRIKKEKAKLILEKKIRKSGNFEDIQDTEKFFNIPDSWSWERLENIGNIFNGNSINKSIKEAKYTGLETGYPYIATKDVGYSFDKINHNNGVRIPFDESKFKVARRGTVLICSEGGSAGKKMGLIEENCCFGNKLYAIEQYGGIESLYILSLYGTASFSQAFQNKMTGIIGGISRNNFAGLLIPLPPLEEQKAIVEVVNSLFKEVEQLEFLTKERVQLKESFVVSALNRLTEEENTQEEWNFLQQYFSSFFTEKKNIKSLRETILQLAVQGKLTETWRKNNPNSEPASELLKRIEAEKQQLIAHKKIRKEKPLPVIEKDEIPYKVPDNWIWCRVGDLSKFVTSGSRDWKKFYSDKGAFFIRSADIKFNQLIPDKPMYVELPEKVEGKRSLVENGDLLTTITGGNVGKCAYIDKEIDESYVSQSVALTKPVDPRVSPYIHICILSPGGAGADLKNSIYGQGRPVLSLPNIREMKVSLPSLDEQKEILKIVNSLMSLCNELEKQIETSQIQIEQLMQSCLKEVFEN